MSFRVTWQDGRTKKLVRAINPKQTEYRRVDLYLYWEEATHGPEDGPGRYSHKGGTRIHQSVLVSRDSPTSILVNTG